MEIAEAIKKMFKSKKLTQAEVAEKIGKAQGNISMYLRNAKGLRIDSLMSMADACGYDVVLVDRERQCESIVLGDSEQTLNVQSEAHMNELFEMFKKWYAEEQIGGEK